MTRKNDNISHSLDRVTHMQAEYISKLFAPRQNKNVLETGSGIGRLSHALYSEGYHVTGLEKSVEYSLFARENRPGPNYISGDISSLKGESFDLIISIYNSLGCFSSCNTSETIIRETTSLLKPGGNLLLQAGSINWARGNFASEDAILENKASDIHTVRWVDWTTPKLITHFNCNGFEYTSSQLLFEKNDIEKQLLNTGFQKVNILDNLGDESASGRDQFFVVAENLLQ